MSSTTVFVAKKIVTMHASNPEATHVAVRDGRILGAGTLDEVSVWGEYVLDETFRDHVLLPGLIEAHAHDAGLPFPYAGRFDRKEVDGSTTKGIDGIPALLARLRELDASMADADAALVVWGFDPIYYDGERLNAKHLDEACPARPVLVMHASFHVATVNSAMLRKHDISRETDVGGVVRGADGEPNGELQEMPAMALARSGTFAILRQTGSERMIRDYGLAARNQGITTTADLGGSAFIDPNASERWQRVVNDPSFPARIVQYNLPSMPGTAADYDAIAERLLELRATATDKLRFPGIKLILDGSIQGYTAVLNEPYYLKEGNGIWMIAPEEIPRAVAAFHKRYINVHAHCNGDATVDAFIDAVDLALRETAWPDHRHTVQHSQLTSAAQYRRMEKLGMCANIFTNHIWYWGDQHYELTVGPERAMRMEACATAKREGVRFSMHSDASVTPLGQLHTMWCAVNRVTPKGRVLGEHEKISAYDALHACTIDAAYQLHLDHEIGSIEAGKRADFAVLEASPLDVEPMAIRDIEVWGTVLGGEKHAAAG